MIGYEAAKALVGPQAKQFLKLMDERLAALEGAEWGSRIKAIEDKLVEERGGGGGNMMTVIKETFTGSSSVVKSFSEDMHGFFLSNDGTGDITFVINGDPFILKSGEVFEGNYDAFTVVEITTVDVPYRAYVSALMDNVGTDRTAPNPVTNLIVGNVAPSTMEVLWTASTSGDVMNYEVAYSQDGTRWTIASNSINAAYQSFVIANLYPDTYYMVRVVAIDTSYNRSNERLTSGTTAPPDTVAPEEVGLITHSDMTEKSFTLKWNASPSKDVAAYEIYQNGAYLGDSTALSYNVTGLSANTNYTFTIKVKDTSGNVSAGKEYSITTVVDTFAPVVTISPVGGSYNAAQNVAITTDEPSTIYYTTDGSAPTVSSNVYSGPITVNSTVTIKCFAKDTAGNSSSVQNVSYMIDITAPDDVTNFNTTNIGERNLTLSWTASASSDVSGYDVYQGTTLLGSTSLNSYEVNGLTPNTSYTFKVVTKDASGNKSVGVSFSVFTLADTTAPNNVSGLNAGSVTETSLTLSWTASTSSDIASYDVFQGTTLLGNTTNTTYNVTGLTINTSYTFTIKAKDNYGNAASGTSVTTTTLSDTTAPNNVTNLQATNVGGTGLTLTWTASTSSDIASYDVFNGTTLMGNTATTSYNVTGLTKNTDYTFTVKAKDSSGNVASGTSVNAKTTNEFTEGTLSWKTTTTGDYILLPAIASGWNEVEISVALSTTSTSGYVADGRNGHGSYWLAGGSFAPTNFTAIYKDGVSQTLDTALYGNLPKGSRFTLKLVPTGTVTSVYTLFNRGSVMYNQPITGTNVYSVKLFKSGVLVAHYDFTHSFVGDTITDQTGNAYSATKSGGVFV